VAENKLALPPVLRKAHDAYLQHYAGLAFLRSRVNAVLAAAGYNFSLLLRWFEELLCVLSVILWRALLATPLHLTRCRKTFFTADYPALRQPCQPSLRHASPTALAFRWSCLERFGARFLH
jgi:hypothetical protein